MKLYLLTLLLLLSLAPAMAQTRREPVYFRKCGFDNTPQPAETVPLPYTPNYENLLRTAYLYAGTPNIDVPLRQTEAWGIWAVIDTTDMSRSIYYSPRYLDEVCRLTGDTSCIKGIGAHELAHHFYNHGMRKIDPYLVELDADWFSGFLMYRMRMTMDDATKAVDAIGTEYNTETHPNKYCRMYTIQQGWLQAYALEYNSGAMAGNADMQGYCKVDTLKKPAYEYAAVAGAFQTHKRQKKSKLAVDVSPAFATAGDAGYLRVYELYGMQIAIQPSGNVTNANGDNISWLQPTDVPGYNAMFVLDAATFYIGYEPALMRLLPGGELAQVGHRL
jgi:hypothetical protein